jgi:predicted enzyme related to lactoylglutathione lyase
MGNPVVRFEIGAADDQALARFYGALFGWGLQAVADGYTVVDTRGGTGINGGIGRSQSGEPWATFYVEVEDPQACLERAGALGGRTVWPVTELPGLAFAMLEDPDGLLVGVQRGGASMEGVVRGPSAGEGAAVDWFEVLGSDAGRSQAFYAELFGWAVPEGAYGLVAAGAEHGIGGGIGAGGEARWATVYASVGDVEATLGRAEGLGATREYGPNQVDDHTWTGMFRDPAGNRFGVYRHGPH